MNAISATRRTIRRAWTTFGTLLIISVGMMGVSDTAPIQHLQSGVNTALAPVESAVNNVTDTLGSYWSALLQIDKLRTQNEQLKQENQQLQEELSRMGAISRLNDDWTKITAAQQSVPYQTTPARVIVRDLSNVTQRTIVLDKGSNDGLMPGEVVVDAGGGLVGRILVCDATVSQVLLIDDPTAVVVGMEAKSGATGTVQGSISGLLTMSYVDASAPLAKGESVVTAGEALPGTEDRSPYPPGLLIGTIVDVNTDPNTVVKSATVEPAAHLEDATFVLVITNYQGGFASPAPGATPFGPTPAGSSGVSGSTQPSPSLNP
jgi:rod shape-determining protein MreC